MGIWMPMEMMCRFEVLNCSVLCRMDGWGGVRYLLCYLYEM